MLMKFPAQDIQGSTRVVARCLKKNLSKQLEEQISSKHVPRLETISVVPHFSPSKRIEIFSHFLDLSKANV